MIFVSLWASTASSEKYLTPQQSIINKTDKKVPCAPFDYITRTKRCKYLSDFLFSPSDEGAAVEDKLEGLVTAQLSAQNALQLGKRANTAKEKVQIVD